MAIRAFEIAVLEDFGNLLPTVHGTGRETSRCNHCVVLTCC